MSIRVYRNKRRRRGRGGGDQKGSARKQRTKVGEFLLGRDKEKMRRRRGTRLKGEEKESRGREVEKDDRGCPVALWFSSRYSRTNWIYELSRLVGPADVGRVGRSLGQIQRTLPLACGSLHGRPGIFYGGDNRKFHDYTTNSRKLRCRIRDRDIWYDTRCLLLLGSFVLSRWWTLERLSVLMQESTLFRAEAAFFVFIWHATIILLQEEYNIAIYTNRSWLFRERFLWLRNTFCYIIKVASFILFSYIWILNIYIICFIRYIILLWWIFIEACTLFRDT